MNQTQAQAALRRLQPFRVGHLVGGFVTAQTADKTGDLPSNWRNKFLEATRSVTPTFVVWSYSTPIFWVAADRTFAALPEIEYSATTTRHQEMVRRQISLMGIQALLTALHDKEIAR